MSDMPTPENRVAWLVPDITDGVGQRVHLVPTRHEYSHTIEHVTPAAPVEGLDPVRQTADVEFRHYFRCSRTGAVRLYGVDGTGLEILAEDD